jgi:hypothetical protein
VYILLDSILFFPFAFLILMTHYQSKLTPLLSTQVHDFGFFRYDPSAIKFLKYDEIPLAPEAASVGLEIRVVGNDSGEKVFPKTSPPCFCREH